MRTNRQVALAVSATNALGRARPTRLRPLRSIARASVAALSSIAATACLVSCDLPPPAPAAADLPPNLAALLDASVAPGPGPDAAADARATEAAAADASDAMASPDAPGMSSFADSRCPRGDAGSPASWRAQARTARHDGGAPFMAPLSLYASTSYAGQPVGVATSILDLGEFPDAEWQCRHLSASPRSFHLAVGYSAVFYAQANYRDECARVDASVDHDVADLTSKCASIESLRLVRGALDTGVEQPAPEP